MNKKGMMPMDMHLLLTSLEAIECICTYEKGKLDTFEKSDKFSNKGKKGKKCLWECLTAVCKALSLADAKGKGTDGLVIRS